MFKSILTSVFAVMLVGCASTSTVNNSSAPIASSIVSHQAGEYEYVSITKETKFKKSANGFTKTDIGSGVQWNEDYVVTAKHVDFVSNSAYSCDTCDLQFIKHKATGAVPQWRERADNEMLTIVGVNQQKNERVVKGKDLNVYNTTNKTVESRTFLTNATITGGMSGGPVYGADNKVIGIATASINGADVYQYLPAGAIQKSQKIAVYVPYSTIQSEWEKFQKSQH